MSKKNYNDIPVKDNVKQESGEEQVEREKVKRVVSGKPKKVKKGLANRLVAGMLGPDGAAGLGEYIMEDMIKPAVQNLVVDTVTAGINRLVYGDKGAPSRGYGRNYSNSYRPTYGGRTNYSNRYKDERDDRDRKDRDRDEQPRRRQSHIVEEFIIEDRHEAVEVLNSLVNHAERYGTVAVADYYEAMGVPSVFTDNNYGWDFNDISRATILPSRRGFVIKFPPTDTI